MAIFVSGLGAVAPVELYVDKEHLRQAIGNKAAAVAIMSPDDFLDLNLIRLIHQGFGHKFNQVS